MGARAIRIISDKALDNTLAFASKSFGGAIYASFRENASYWKPVACVFLTVVSQNTALFFQNSSLVLTEKRLDRSEKTLLSCATRQLGSGFEHSLQENSKAQPVLGLCLFAWLTTVSQFLGL